LPYKFGVGFDGDPVESRESVESSGWIKKTLASPKVSSDQAVVIHIVVIDSEARRANNRYPSLLSYQ